VGCACEHSLKKVTKECGAKCSKQCVDECEKPQAAGSFLEMLKGYIIPNNAPSKSQEVGSPDDINSKVESQAACFAQCDAKCRPECVKKITQVNCS